MPRKTTLKNLTAVLCCCLGVAAHASEPPTPGQAKELRSELLKRMKVDQDARYAWINWMIAHKLSGKDPTTLPPEQKAEYEKHTKAAKEVDIENTAWLKEIVDKYGWPTIGLVGTDGAKAAWILVQHADQDVKFQRKCLDLMAALPKDEVSQMDLAYLTDRVLLSEGKKQIYGTQFTSVDGQFQPRPLEDEASVDARRAEVGLPPIAEYVKVMKEVYKGNAK